MDELLIEDKKYVSSKRAAKITGYAKDYIGQLCREGRVPARLVGRSWYVLESAIQDHRFGIKDIEQNNAQSAENTVPALPKTWESPRYEAATHESLPTIKRLTALDSDQPAPQVAVLEKNNDSAEYLQDSWKEWFEHIADKQSEPIVEEKQEIQEEKEEQEQQISEEEVNIPIHTVYELPPEDLLPGRRTIPRVDEEILVEEEGEEERGINRKRAIYRSIQVSGLLIAAITAVLGTVGSGFYDMYLAQNDQATVITGVRVYTK